MGGFTGAGSVRCGVFDFSNLDSPLDGENFFKFPCERSSLYPLSLNFSLFSEKPFV